MVRLAALVLEILAPNLRPYEGPTEVEYFDCVVDHFPLRPRYNLPGRQCPDGYVVYTEDPYDPNLKVINFSP